MTTGTFAFLVKVRKMDEIRAFYRDILQLGEPETDSGFWVEFAINDQAKLILERTDATYLEHESAATAWVMDCGDKLGEVRDNLLHDGFRVALVESVRPGAIYYRTADPENNPVYLAGTLPGDAPDPLGPILSAEGSKTAI